MSGPFRQGFLYVDALSAVLLLVVAILNFTANLFSISYMEKEVWDGHISVKMLSRYYGLCQVFVFTMIGVLVVENLGLMWVAVEATTLSSALLVAFYFNRSALEAAWKYVMVCTVGICMALLGTILLYYAQVSAAGPGSEALSWLALRQMQGMLDPALAKLAFVFIVIGYGTKVGLAPMHTWLPDAHSQAPSPVSGLLSGALLSCAAYALIRNVIVLQGSLPQHFVQYVLIGFGLLSVCIAVPFIMVQHDLKRLLAYSSVEHMGLILFGFGLNTQLAIYGALLHIINHALVKSSLFYSAGVITQEYHTKHMARIRGLLSTMPVVATLFVMSVLAITGTPPFNIFISKFTIIYAAFQDGKAGLGVIILLLMAAIFAGMVYYCLSMVYRSKPFHMEQVKVGKPALLAMGMSVCLALVAGFYLPPWLHNMLSQAAMVVKGGTNGGI
jgi:hydrogenase-4 component F